MIKIGNIIVKTDFANEMRENITEQVQNGVQEIVNGANVANQIKKD